MLLDHNPNSFAEEIGVKAAVIYNIIKGRRNKPSYDLLEKILHHHTVVNADWLLRGDGEALDYSRRETITPTEAPPRKLRASIESHVLDVLADLRASGEDDPRIMEVSELIMKLIRENEAQKLKIIELYEKHEKTMDVLRRKFDLDI